ncbi:MAG: hypothetical protein WDW38_003633 [Sanguina aurantia]
MGRLTSLTVRQSSGTDLLAVLRSATSLGTLSILAAGVTAPPLLLTYADSTQSLLPLDEVTRFREHLQRGFRLNGAAVRLSGSASDVTELMSWLHPQPAVTVVVMPENLTLTQQKKCWGWLSTSSPTCSS